MRMIGLLLGALLINVSCFAGSSALNNTVKSAIQNSSTQQSKINENSKPIIYGGKDIYRQDISSQTV